MWQVATIIVHGGTCLWFVDYSNEQIQLKSWNAINHQHWVIHYLSDSTFLLFYFARLSKLVIGLIAATAETETLHISLIINHKSWWFWLTFQSYYHCLLLSSFAIFMFHLLYGSCCLNLNWQSALKLDSKMHANWSEATNGRLGVGDVHADAVVGVSTDDDRTVLQVERKVGDVDVARGFEDAARFPVQFTVISQHDTNTFEVWNQFFCAVINIQPSKRND